MAAYFAKRVLLSVYHHLILVTTLTLIWYGAGLARAGGSGRQKRTLNTDPRYGPWNTKEIPYAIDESYTPEQKDLIREAATMVGIQVQTVVTFVEVPRSDSRYKIFVAPYNNYADKNNPKKRPVCDSLPGMVLSPTERAKNNEQIMTIVPGKIDAVAECLDLDRPRGVMKWFVHTLGRLMELRRGDRDTYVRWIYPVARHGLYNASQADWSHFPFDYCSITMEKPNMTSYMSIGGIDFHFHMFRFLNGISYDTDAAQLSNTDCQLIHMYYGGDPTECPPYDCRSDAPSGFLLEDLMSPTSTQPTTMPASTLAPSTTTKKRVQNPCPDFCNLVPTESTYLLGPFSLYQTYLLFAGNCVAEYVMDWAAFKLKLQTTPQLITDYFPAPGGPTMQPPIHLAYFTVPESGIPLSHLVNQVLGKSLECMGDFTKSTEAEICSTPAGSKGIIKPSIASSASSQVNQGDSLIYQYTVNAAGSEVELRSEDFATRYQSTSGLLGKKRDIVRITAIQIIEDMMYFNGSVMAVFGFGADGKQSLVGFVRNMRLDAFPKAALTGTDTGFIDPTSIKPLKDVIIGCP